MRGGMACGLWSRMMAKQIRGETMRFRRRTMQSRCLSTESSHRFEYAKSSKFGWLLKPFGYYSKSSQAILSANSLFQGIEMQTNCIGFKTLFLDGAVVKKEIDEVKTKEGNGSEKSVDNQFWLVDYELDWQTYQELLMLNLWIVNRRLMHSSIPGDRRTAHLSPPSRFQAIYTAFKDRLLSDRPFGKVVQENLFYVLWENTQRRIRRTKLIPEISVNKNLQEVQKYSIGACVNYDYAMQFYTTDQRKAREHLEAAIWRNVFKSDPLCDEESVLLLTQYVFDQLNHLYPQQDRTLKVKQNVVSDPALKQGFDEGNQTVLGNSLERASDGALSWIDAPLQRKKLEEIKTTVMAGNSESTQFVDYDELVWIPALDVHGKRYFWNKLTRESTWENKFASS